MKQKWRKNRLAPRENPEKNMARCRRFIAHIVFPMSSFELIFRSISWGIKCEASWGVDGWCIVWLQESDDEEEDEKADLPWTFLGICGKAFVAPLLVLTEHKPSVTPGWYWTPDMVRLSSSGFLLPGKKRSCCGGQEPWTDATLVKRSKRFHVGTRVPGCPFNETETMRLEALEP